jgi:hypothetical protein
MYAPLPIADWRFTSLTADSRLPFHALHPLLSSSHTPCAFSPASRTSSLSRKSNSPFTRLVMKKQFTHKAIVALQMLVLAAVVGLAAFGLLSFKAAQRYTDFWQILGTDKQSGTMNIKESFLGGYLQHAGASNLKKIVTGDRVAVTQDLLAYTKQYVSSEVFVKAYSAERERVKPVAPAPAKTADQVRKEFIESTQAGIDNMEKFMKTADASMKKSAQEGLDQLKQSLKDYQDPNNELIKMSVTGNKMQYDAQVKEYNEKLSTWETKYPADVKSFVKARLQQLLAITKDVDFNAQLTERNGRRYFANAAYEHKNGNWKMAFRAGKEVTTAVRAFVQQWLTEL